MGFWIRHWLVDCFKCDGYSIDVFLMSPAEFVCAENLHRRHLTASQRAQMVVEAHGWRQARYGFGFCGAN